MYPLFAIIIWSIIFIQFMLVLFYHTFVFFKPKSALLYILKDGLFFPFQKRNFGGGKFRLLVGPWLVMARHPAVTCVSHRS